MNGHAGTFGRSPLNLDACRRCGAPGEFTKVSPLCARCRRSDRLVAHYGLTADEVDAMVAAVDGRCPICERVTERWAVDHDHGCCPGKKSCGACVRGVLCSDCNSAIGLLQESPVALQRAIAYLDRNRG